MEHTVNDALASVLRVTRAAWRPAGVVSSEHTKLLKDSNGRPDILICEANVSPVVIETELMPAITVEKEAKERLGKILRKNGQPILSSIAVRLPDRFKELSDFSLKENLLSAHDLEYALFSGETEFAATRWPEKGWMLGSFDTLSQLAQSASVPQIVIENAADRLTTGVHEAAGILQDSKKEKPGALDAIAKALCQESGEQTLRMATTILANAFVFHENLSHGPGELKDVLTIGELRNLKKLTRSGVLEEWGKILAVNYWPIFDIARQILQVIPINSATLIAASLAQTAERLVESRLTKSHDLTGAVFQKLISDRKFLAAYYTTPASAAFMVGLALNSNSSPSGAAWGSVDSLKKMKIADFACGTGTLLSTAYARIGQLHELGGGNAEVLHSTMMGDVLVGCDVLPSAAHLTASMLAGAHPTSIYQHSSVMTVPYGLQPDGSFALGSLDLLDKQQTHEIIGNAALIAGAKGQTAANVWTAVPHNSFDLVLMNPPFTRPTGHEGKKVGVPNPMFAAFSSTKEEQTAMGTAFKKLIKGLPKNSSYTGNAGEGSAFLELAHQKLKMGGTISLILPLSLMVGDAWQKCRNLLVLNYANLVVASIAGSPGSDVSFSADTGMAECLFVAEKSMKGSKRAIFVVLKDKPKTTLEGYAISSEISRLVKGGAIRNLEDGPFGGSSLRIGDITVGHLIGGPIGIDTSWNIARIADLSLAQTAYELIANSRVWLPSTTKSSAIPIQLVETAKIGKIGPYHADVAWNSSSGGIRGPFKIKQTNSIASATYPVLWAHDAARETTIVFEGDSEGEVIQGKNEDDRNLIAEKVAEIHKTASHLHFNQNFRFNSQPAAMQLTTRATIGGRAWLSLSMATYEQECAMAVWGNTTLGLLVHWWHANKQQVGRGNIGKEALATLPVLDVSKFSAEQNKRAKTVLDKFQSKHLRPFNEIHLDEVRAQLDKDFLSGVLGFPESLFSKGGPFELLRQKLAAEPSVTGHKKSD